MHCKFFIFHVLRTTYYFSTKINIWAVSNTEFRTLYFFKITQWFDFLLKADSIRGPFQEFISENWGKSGFPCFLRETSWMLVMNILSKTGKKNILIIRLIAFHSVSDHQWNSLYLGNGWLIDQCIFCSFNRGNTDHGIICDLLRKSTHFWRKSSVSFAVNKERMQCLG